MPPTSLGCLYSALGVLEAVVPMVATALLTLLYNSTSSTWPGAVFLARSLGMALAAVLYAVLGCRIRATHQNTLDLVS